MSITLLSLIFGVLQLAILPLSAEELSLKDAPIVSGEEAVETSHQMMIAGQSIDYKATVGNIILKNDQDKPQANLFYISYIKETQGNEPRPISFCFNGGPGSSSVWLHMGLLGPKRVLLNETGVPIIPYQLVDNDFSLLDVSDLVFIDPVSTGFSHALPLQDEKHFHSTTEDVKSVAEFIRLYLTRNNRWNSPKFIIGESYGTTRAVSLADALHEQYFVTIDGLVLISAVLNFATLDFGIGNDLPYALYLPTYTATAWYHNKLSNAQQQGSLQEALKIATDFVTKEYTPALFKGQLLSKEERDEIANKLANLTGMKQEFIAKNNLRIDNDQFVKQLFFAQGLAVGIFDGRFKGYSEDGVTEGLDFDPGTSALFGSFTATLNYYLRNHLKVMKDNHYKILTNVQPWNYGMAYRAFNVMPTLRSSMIRNPHLKVFVGSGYYDLNTPYFATAYTFNHLWLEQSLQDNITMKWYEAGHMMYIHQPSLKQLKSDLVSFYLPYTKSVEKTAVHAAVAR